MDWIALRGRAMEFINKYKFVALILLLGLVLMSIPSRKDTDDTVEEATVPAVSEQSLDESLAQILSQIEGAGKVQVMLTVAAGEETIYQVDEDISTDQDSSTTHRDTVTVTDSDRDQTGLVRQVNPPRYQGVIVVCQGADSPTVQLAIIEAVSKVTGLGTDRISVLKMK